jgi:glycosyltransferase involved in cell wall biosynthesis
VSRPAHELHGRVPPRGHNRPTAGFGCTLRLRVQTTRRPLVKDNGADVPPSTCVTHSPPVSHLLIVVPARNEEAHIEACLTALEHAVRRIHAHPLPDGATTAWPPPSVAIVAVLDSCTDATARLVAEHPSVEVVSTRSGRVGAARSLGVRYGLDLASDPARHVWIANTDADSQVPPDWLTQQLDAAHAGVDLFCGLVEPAMDDCGRAAYASWASTYQRSDGHPHVHGANLGIRADAYLAAGGFDPAATAHEDVELVRAARAGGFNVVSSGAASVATSGRMYGRVSEDGFAAYLRGYGQRLVRPDELGATADLVSGGNP